MDPNYKANEDALKDLAEHPEVAQQIQEATSASSAKPKRKSTKKVVPEVKAEKTNPAFCGHDTVKKDKYGKDLREYVPGRGIVFTCGKCGARLTQRMFTDSPKNIPGTKVRMSKKDRRLGRKIQKEISEKNLLKDVEMIK